VANLDQKNREGFGRRRNLIPRAATVSVKAIGSTKKKVPNGWPTYQCSDNKEHQQSDASQYDTRNQALHLYRL